MRNIEILIKKYLYVKEGKKYLANFLIRNIVSREIVQLPNIQKKRQKNERFL